MAEQSRPDDGERTQPAGQGLTPDATTTAVSDIAAIITPGVRPDVAPGLAPDLVAELAAEHDDLDHRVRALTEEQWRWPTPATGWDIADSISHLWYFDQRAIDALAAPDRFASDAAALLAAGGSTEVSVLPGRSMTGAELLDSWRADRRRLLEIAAVVDLKARVPWYGPPMSARSFLTARLMETWAHGIDIADALSAACAPVQPTPVQPAPVRPAPVQPTPRLRHVVHIAVAARPYSYMVHGRAVPDDDVYVELTGPVAAPAATNRSEPSAVDTWTWGNPAAISRVIGDALEFCLVATQRRHVDDTDLHATGSAVEWLTIAQAFAGGAGAGRRPAADNGMS